MNKTSLIKKTLIVILAIIYIGICKSNIYAITESFNFMIDTIGIPRYNVNGLEINEDIYDTYNVLVYGSPEYLEGRNNEQRWKNSKYGLWARYIGSYRGYGNKGEYNLLGLSYTGTAINNYYFPMDAIPTISPEKWKYYYVPGGIESWNDINKYKTQEQLDFMKNTNLMFNDIASRDRADNPEFIKKYNITANGIGLNNTRLDTASTWKTNGIIYTRRKIGNKIWYAVFLTEPMAANANIKSTIQTSMNNYILKYDKDNINIEISFGAEIYNLTGYANSSHIKEITSDLYINGEKVKSISGSKTLTMSNKYMVTIPRKSLIPQANNTISLKSDSYAHTEFVVDGLMRNMCEKNINIYVEKERDVNNDIVLIEKENEKMVVSPLAQTKETAEKQSQGIVEAGRNIGICVYGNYIKDNINVIIDNKKIKNEILFKNENVTILIIKVPNNINSTIYGWKSLREKNKNFFGINYDNIGERKLEPHIITISDGINEICYSMDTIDDYVSNMNYVFNKQLINTNNEKRINIEEWICSKKG